jgi:hypothetical protein
VTVEFTSAQVNEKLHKIRWQQDHARRGYERNRMSPELAEALRTEIRSALDAGGSPFDVNVARRVYDLAIAARDMCIAASDTVKEAIDQIKDTNGPMETLDSPDTPESQMQVSETFGARIMRELLAMMPAFRKNHEEDPHVIIAAIADARARGMHDLAAKLEQRLIGTPLEQPKITSAEVVANSYEHGFVHGSMQDNFDSGTVNGVAGRDRQHWSPAYKEGYEAGRARRLISGDTTTKPPIPPITQGEFDNEEPPQLDTGSPHAIADATEQITTDGKIRCWAWSYPGHPVWEPKLEHPSSCKPEDGRQCVLDNGHFGDHELVGGFVPRESQPSLLENAFVDHTRCARCGDWKGDHHPRCTVSRRRPHEQELTQCPCPEFVACEHPTAALYDSPYDDGYQVFCRNCGKHMRLGRLSPSPAVSPPSVRGIDICAGCGSRECFNVCCHPSNKQREASNRSSSGDAA